MLDSIQTSVKQLFPARHKTSASGWVSFNAVCCEHNGESRDTRSRGGVICNTDGSVSYSCFNCGFKANYKPGRHLNFKFRKLLSWLGADDNTVKRLVIEAIRIRELVSPDTVQTDPDEPIVITARPLPSDAYSFHNALRVMQTSSETSNTISDHMLNTAQYLQDRGIDIQRYDFYVSENPAHNLHQRVIIPFTWNSEIIGYTARALVDNIKPKYYSQHEPNFVFNVNAQTPERKFVIVCEGPFDAMSVDGVALLGNECSEQQAEIIDRLARRVIVVPDADRPGAKLVDHALEYGWDVSFPIWHSTHKDINSAVQQFGKLFVIKSILASAETSRLKIELRKKKLHG